MFRGFTVGISMLSAWSDHNRTSEPPSHRSEPTGPGMDILYIYGTKVSILMVYIYDTPVTIVISNTNRSDSNLQNARLSLAESSEYLDLIGFESSDVRQNDIRTKMAHNI